MKHRFTSLADYLDRGPETQEQLAARTGLSQTTVSLAKNYGRGSFRTLRTLSRAGDFPIESFARKDAA